MSDLKTSNFSVIGLAFAQTHVIDSYGCRWEVENNSGNGKQVYELHSVGYRDALVLVEFDGSINSPKTICYDKQENKLVELSLELPEKLPASDYGINDNFNENIWSGTLPKECFIPGSQISFKVEIDVFIEDYNIALEYDGWFYHENKLNNDLQKNK